MQKAISKQNEVTTIDYKRRIVTTDNYIAY